MSRLFLSKCFLLSMLLLALQAASAQRMPPQQRGPDRGPDQRMERLQQLKKLRLLEVLKLNEEESIRFFTRYNKFEEELRDLERERNDIIDDLEMQLKEGEKVESLEKSFDDLFALGQKVVDARIRFYKEVRGMLTPQQVAKLIVFERNFTRDLREIIQDVQRERRRGFQPR